MRLLAGLLLALVGACEEATPPPNTGGASGGGGGVAAGSSATATDFTTRDIEGRTFRLSDHLGKNVVLIDFWATWCQPCLAEWPHLERLYQELKPKGFTIVAVSMDGADSLAEVPSFARRNNVTFDVVYDEDSHIASIYNPRKSAPLTAIIDRKGHVAYVHEGYNPGDELSLAAQARKYVEEPR